MKGTEQADELCCVSGVSWVAWSGADDVGIRDCTIYLEVPMSVRLSLTLLTAAAVACGGDKPDTGSDGSADLVGSWARNEPLVVDGVDGQVVWTGQADGTCGVELSTSMGNLEFSGTYTASGGTFTMSDERCGAGTGTYTYVLSGDQVSFTLVDDPCTDRADTLVADWTRE